MFGGIMKVRRLLSALALAASVALAIFGLFKTAAALIVLGTLVELVTSVINGKHTNN
jgi:hypothetical protein